MLWHAIVTSCVNELKHGPHIIRLLIVDRMDGPINVRLFPVIDRKGLIEERLS